MDYCNTVNSLLTGATQPGCVLGKKLVTKNSFVKTNKSVHFSHKHATHASVHVCGLFSGDHTIHLI